MPEEQVNTITEQERESLNKSGFENFNPDPLELEALREEGHTGPVIVDATEAMEQTDKDINKLNQIQESVNLVEKQAKEVQKTAETMQAREELEKTHESVMTVEEAREIFGDEANLGAIGQVDPKTGLFAVSKSPDSKTRQAGLSPEAELVINANEAIDAETGDYSYYDERSKIVGEQYNALVESIRQNFEAKKTAMKDVNKRSLAQLRQIGFRMGTQKYTPLTATNVITAEERAGIKRIAELDAQMNSLILQAQQAKDKEQFDLLNEKMTKIENAQAEQQKALQEQNKLLIEQQAEWQEEQDRIQNELAVTTLIQEGVTNPVEIANLLEGKVPFESVVAITDTYKDAEKIQKEVVNKALQSANLDAETQEYLMSDVPLWQKEFVALDVLRGEAKDNLMWDRKLDEAQLANIYSAINDRNRNWQLRLQERQEKFDKEGKEAELDLMQDMESAVGIVSLITEINSLYDNNFVGKTSVFPSLPGTKRDTFEKKVDRLANLFTLENLDLMSGVLSESDIAILRSAGTDISYEMTEKAFKRELKKLNDMVLPMFERAHTEGVITDIEYYELQGYDTEEIAQLIATGQIQTTGSEDITDQSINKWYQE